MLKVDTVYGNDDSQEEKVFKTLNKAITVSKKGDTIVLSPGTFDSFMLSSKVDIFDLSFKGTGNNTHCTSSTFNGFFDVSFEDMKLDSFEIKSISSNFSFRNVRFVSLHVMELYGYNDLPANGNHTKTTYISFDRCRFDYNFQIILREGDYVLSFTSCQFIGNVPLIYAKKGMLKINLTNINFEHTILKNDKAIVEYSHVSCNFSPDIPFYVGNECTDKSRETIQGHFSPTVREKSVSVLGVMSNSEEEYQKEFYGAISFSSNDSDTIRAHRYTRLINNTGTVPLKVILPREADNGHHITIISERAPIIIEDRIYREACIMLGFIYDHGWIKIPLPVGRI